MTHIRTFLEGVPLTEVLDEFPEVYTLKSNNTVNDALTLFGDKQILSCPIRVHSVREFAGFVDVLDLLHCILSNIASDQQKIEWTSHAKDLATLTAKGKDLGGLPLQGLTDNSHVDPFLPVSEFHSIWDVVENVFARGVKRAPVFADNELNAIVSQSNVMKVLARKLENLGPVATKPVGKLQLGSQNIATLHFNDLAIDAFLLMRALRIDAVAVVDTDGTLLANISASNLKGIVKTGLEGLLLPIREFLIRAEARFLRHPLKCNQNTKFGTLVNSLAMYRLHRAWLVDEFHKPVGVISLEDICKFICPKPGNRFDHALAAQGD